MKCWDGLNQCMEDFENNGIGTEESCHAEYKACFQAWKDAFNHDVPA